MNAKILLSVIMSIVLLLAPCVFAQQAGQDPRALARFQSALNEDGFDVTPGAAMVWDPLGDLCAGTIPSARLANSGLYLILNVPKKVPKQGEIPDLTTRFKIRHDEAVVLIGQTPPPAKYFGFYAWIGTRFYPDKGRTEIFGTVGDAVNNATIKTTGSAPFNTPFALIYTPDQGTDAGIRAALRRAGYPEAIINTNVLPASMLKLGDEETADDFQISLRTALFEDPIAGQRYIQGAPQTLHIFRVTPRTPAIPNPFLMPPLRVRGTGESEMRLMNKLGELRAAIIAANAGNYHATDFRSAIANYEDYDNLQREIWADGGTRDAFNLSAGWQMPQPYLNDIITLGDDEFLMVYGVNHVATRKTTYMNINFYATGRKEDGGPPVPKWDAFVGGVSDDLFPGTATGYLPGDLDANLMYAYKVSRNCGKDEPNCLPLSAPCKRVILDSSTVLGLFFRMYLEPATKVGAAMQEILYDRVIKFSPRP
ncbi:MAG: hypothetical protein CXR31_01580 [Geobacter sp.]|nr:MAG: hypothetical protein CXR31_01580 [Geobacter sp.]